MPKTPPVQAVSGNIEQTTTVTCPACGRAMTRQTVAGVDFDVCAGGCGGLWCDWHELEKVDEPNEAAGDALLDVPRDPAVHVALQMRRTCPRDGTEMMRHYTSTTRRVTVDECPQCGGFLLDPGELARIRGDFHSDAERRAAADKYFTEVFGSDLTKMHAETEAQAARAHKVAHALRFVCPSHWIPGKQEWGAF